MRAHTRPSLPALATIMPSSLHCCHPPALTQHTTVPRPALSSPSQSASSSLSHSLPSSCFDQDKAKQSQAEQGASTSQILPIPFTRTKPPPPGPPPPPRLHPPPTLARRHYPKGRGLKPLRPPLPPPAKLHPTVELHLPDLLYSHKQLKPNLGEPPTVMPSPWSQII